MIKQILSAVCLTGCFVSASAADITLENDSAVAVAMEPRMYMGHEVETVPASFDTGNKSWWSGVRATGTIQTDFLVPLQDKQLNTPEYDKPVLNNTYFDLTVNAPYVSVGARLEWAKWPLPQYTDKNFKGWGVPYLWATGKYKWAQLTVGDFYEQFGSGLILRIYNERSIGFDNAIRGGRVKLNPVAGLQLTALGGKSRYFWEHNSSWIWGGDAEWNIDQTFRKAFNRNYGLMLGFSYVGKHEPDEVIYATYYPPTKLNLPLNIASFDARARFRFHNFSLLGEFAHRSADPNFNNNYTYHPGTAALVSLTYAANGLSAYFQAKRSDNMCSTAERSMEGVYTFYNHLPAFTMTQTYALASLYPYATYNNGEWAFQAEVRYLFKKGTPLGGKYGMNARISASYISALDRKVPEGADFQKPPIGSNGWSTPFWKIGSLNYADVNVELNKKFNRKIQLTLFYLFQKYNQAVIEGHGGMIDAHTVILEGQWKIQKKWQLRWEAQYLNTKQDKKDWLAGLLELSFAPHWMLTLTDTYNIGEKMNYYSALLTFNYKANRFTFGYGRVRDGYNCAGGVCRYVPAYKGFNLSYNYTF